MRGAAAVVPVDLLAAQQAPVRDSAAVHDSLQRDSLAARLARAEAAIALLRRQLAIEASSAVRTRSRIQLELSARIVTNAFHTSQRVNNVDVPQFALPSPTTLPSVPPVGRVAQPGTQALGLSLRQSRIGAAITVDSVLGGTFEGDLDIDFFGGVTNGAGDRRLFPEPRLRTAQARWHRGRTAVLVGSETPLISDLNPLSPAAIGVPGFVTAGNLWNWLPQVRLSQDLLVTGNDLRIGVQGALLSPFTGVQNIAETDATDAGERSGRPFVQGRMSARWGTAGAGDSGSDALLAARGGEIGIGVHRGWVRADGDSLRTSRAVSLDARVSLTARIELRGEAYRGRLVRGLGGGAIGQSFGRAEPGQPVGASLRDAAGWVQLNVQPHTTLIAGVGCGGDRVPATDLPLRLSNRACAAHLMWRPAQPMLIGFEFRQIATRYESATNRANHLNLSFGFEL